MGRPEPDHGFHQVLAIDQGQLAYTWKFFAIDTEPGAQTLFFVGFVNLPFQKISGRLRGDPFFHFFGQAAEFPGAGGFAFQA